MEWHPIAKIFPMMEEQDLQALADDIRDNGLREPILTFAGKVLDGRNREAACKLAGVTPAYKAFSGTHEEAVSLVWSANRVRRHLTKSQIAVAEAKTCFEEITNPGMAIGIWNDKETRTQAEVVQAMKDTAKELRKKAEECVTETCQGVR